MSKVKENEVSPVFLKETIRKEEKIIGGKKFLIETKLTLVDDERYDPETYSDEEIADPITFESSEPTKKNPRLFRKEKDVDIPAKDIAKCLENLDTISKTMNEEQMDDLFYRVKKLEGTIMAMQSQLPRMPDLYNMMKFLEVMGVSLTAEWQKEMKKYKRESDSGA